MAKNSSHVSKLAFKFVLTIGIVNLFADMTYEGARSITGPFLESLGASALAVVYRQRSDGIPYDRALMTLIVFSVVCQLAALPVFMWGNAQKGPR